MPTKLTPPESKLNATRDLVSAAVSIADGWLALRRRVQRVPGVQWAVAIHGDIICSSALGVADVATGTPLTPKHLFRIASHSKTFTATVILQLVEAGKLRLDDAIGAPLPWVPAPIADVTIRELLAHGGGVTRDGFDLDYWILGEPFPDEARLRGMLPSEAAITAPNEQFKYSNIGYSLLGLAIEAVTGQTFAEAVTAGVISPLGLADTSPDLDVARLDDYASGHTSLSYLDERKPIEQVPTGAMAAATGFSSTASDVVRYFAAHAQGNDQLLSANSKRLAQREEWMVNGAEVHYGLGFVVQEIGKRRTVGHSGGWPGHITKTVLDPTDGLTVSVLTNAIDGPAGEWAVGIVKLIDLALAPSTAPASEVDLDRFVGAYGNIWGRMDIVRFGSRLLALTLNQADPTAGFVELTPVDDSTLKQTGGGSDFGSRGETMHFVFADDGSVVRLQDGGGHMLPIDGIADLVASVDRITAPA